MGGGLGEGGRGHTDAVRGRRPSQQGGVVRREGVLLVLRRAERRVLHGAAEDERDAHRDDLLPPRERPAGGHALVEGSGTTAPAAHPIRQRSDE